MSALRPWLAVATAAGLVAAAPAVRAQTAAPDDPYPPAAAGWGPEAGGGLMVSRWAEDWSRLRASGVAPDLKAMPAPGGATLTLGGEARLRWDVFDDARLTPGADSGYGLLRAVAGADLRLGPQLRIYGELGAGRALNGEGLGPSFRNEVSVQQLFVEGRGRLGPVLVGAMVGRQEFADGPRQLLSLGDGPNLHRTWNGVRLYAHGRRWRLGAFDLAATRLGPDAFDEAVNGRERLQGVNAGLVLTSDAAGAVYLDPFWLRARSPALRLAGRAGPDDRRTAGVRLWGRRGAHRFDWTVARQSGDFAGREIDAWGLFAIHSVELSSRGWKPRLTARLDLASGGPPGSAVERGFNPLYASSSHLGEGQFLGLRNLLMATPGVTFAPATGRTVSIEYGFARRLETGEAAYGGGLRPYAGTQAARGREIGGLLRVAAAWTVSPRLALSVNYERMQPGPALERAGLRPGAYGSVAATVRY
jgi:hypothetical protein